MAAHDQPQQRMRPAEDRPGRQVAVAALGQAFGAFMGLALGGPDLGPILAAALVPYGEQWMRRVAAEWNRKGTIIAAAALEAPGLDDPRDLAERLTADPRLIALMQKIAQAAAGTAHEAKLRTFGRLLGGAVAASGDRLDETQLLVSALADLENAHIVVLDILTGPPPDDEHYARIAVERERTRGQIDGGSAVYEPPPPVDPGELMSYEDGTWLPEQIQALAPLDPEFAAACLSVLIRHGLVRALGTHSGGSRFKITDFGRALVRVMQHAAEPKAESADSANLA